MRTVIFKIDQLLSKYALDANLFPTAYIRQANKYPNLVFTMPIHDIRKYIIHDSHWAGNVCRWSSYEHFKKLNVPYDLGGINSDSFVALLALLKDCDLAATSPEEIDAIIRSYCISEEQWVQNHA